MGHAPTPRQIERLLAFKGYGNPKGKLWFLGMEEHGDGSLRELQIRADQFDEVEDLYAAHRKVFPDSDMSLHVPVWATMSRIALRLSGSVSWNAREDATSYQMQRLGRREGETFLTELLPLPARDTASWPYDAIYPTRAAYRAAVLPQRVEILGNLIEAHTPETVFCYGKTNWPAYE